MLAGFSNDTGKSMFPAMEQSLAPQGPTPEAMSKEMDALQHTVRTTLTAYQAQHFDLSSAEEEEKYSKLMLNILKGVEDGTHALLHRHRQYLADEPKSVVWLEWTEYTIEKKPIETIGEG